MSTFTVKFHGSRQTTTAHYDTFEDMDQAVQEWQDKGDSCDAYELRDGKTIDPYTEEEVNMEA